MSGAVNKAEVAGKVLDAQYFPGADDKKAFLRCSVAYNIFTTSDGEVKEPRVAIRLYGEVAEYWFEALVPGEWMKISGRLAQAKDTRGDGTEEWRLYVTTENTGDIEQVDENTFANSISITGDVASDTNYHDKRKDESGALVDVKPVMRPLLIVNGAEHRVSASAIIIGDDATAIRSKLGKGATVAISEAALVNRQLDGGAWTQELVGGKVKVVKEVAPAWSNKQRPAAGKSSGKPAAGKPAPKPAAGGKPAPRGR